MINLPYTRREVIWLNDQTENLTSSAMYNTLHSLETINIKLKLFHFRHRWLAVFIRAICTGVPYYSNWRQARCSELCSLVLFSHYMASMYCMHTLIYPHVSQFMVNTDWHLKPHTALVVNKFLHSQKRREVTFHFTNPSVLLSMVAAKGRHYWLKKFSKYGLRMS